MPKTEPRPQVAQRNVSLLEIPHDLVGDLGVRRALNFYDSPFVCSHVALGQVHLKLTGERLASEAIGELGIGEFEDVAVTPCILDSLLK